MHSDEAEEVGLKAETKINVDCRFIQVRDNVQFNLYKIRVSRVMVDVIRRYGRFA